jgi:rod shape-determining protein MreC
VYDKQVRRRRLTLAAFVVASLLLLTVYFGEGSGGGPLHSLQRGALSVLGPVQEGAHRALKPVRDLFGWVGDTIDAKKERDRLVEENEQLRRDNTELEALRSDVEQLRGLIGINEASSLEDYEPVPALVYARSPNVFYSKVQIDKGASAGVEAGQPVVNGLGLVGRVTEVTPGYSEVTLITDESFAAGAKVLEADQQTTVRASPNKPEELELALVQNADKISRGDKVVTTGSTSARFPSFYPRNVLIGTVSDVELGEGNLDSRIRVRPAVDLGNIEWVEVLTGVEPPPGT